MLMIIISYCSISCCNLNLVVKGEASDENNKNDRNNHFCRHGKSLVDCVNMQFYKKLLAKIDLNNTQANLVKCPASSFAIQFYISNINTRWPYSRVTLYCQEAK